MTDQSTRRMEMGLPLFPDLNVGLLQQAGEQIDAGDPAGMVAFITSLGKTGQLKTVRKLAALWTASPEELKKAESDPEALALLEDRAADLPFADTFRAAQAFHAALWASLRPTPGSSEGDGAPAHKKDKGRKASAGSPSEG
jgi:hypothetical protein